MDADALNRSIQTLSERKDAWASLPVRRKLDYLDSIMRRYPAVAGRQVSACIRAKGIEEGTPRSGEEWAHPYQTMRLLRLLRATLNQFESRGQWQFPKRALRARANGQLVARVFPLSAIDLLLYPGFHGEVWMQEGVTEENLARNSVDCCRPGAGSGRVTLVLGAGNVASIGPGDLLHKLLVEGQVCIFKHNPVVDYLGPLIEEAFASLVEDGFLRFVYGGTDTGEYLCRHSEVDEIHLTGSDRTYDAIVFGTGEEGRQRKHAGRPRLHKRFTCELGNATPVIVVPGPWSDSDIQFHAENIVSQMTINCGFNCLSAKVLILHKDWPQSRDLMDAIRTLLAATPQRKAYYPGAEERYDEVVAVNGMVEPIGPRSPGVLPYTIVSEIDPADRDNPCFASECFMPLLAQTSLPGADAAEFLDRAVEFSNQTLWGTLSGSIIVHPAAQRELGVGLEKAIARMRYGTVSVNQWTALGYLWGSPTWGAYPGHLPTDIQSGAGFVHNSFLFDRPEKSVIYGPFRMWPKPAWFVTNVRTHKILPRLFELECAPSILRALQVVFTALRG
ncbi:MAG: aldehyde dehydrogenase [Acidobacteria bacterium]|nr:aldehyde dehydrogenase [Acidobacteriota bacterium]